MTKSAIAERWSSARAAICSIGAAWIAAGCASPPPPLDPARFESEIKAFEESDRRSPPELGGIVFVGSSSIRLWKLEESFPGTKALNRGFGGSHISDNIAYAPRTVLAYRPSRILFYAGDNDIAAHKSAETVLADWQSFRGVVHDKLPDAQIVFISIKPSPSRWELWPEAKRANALIRADCAHDLRLRFLDAAAPMLGADGLPRPELYVADRLHMNAAGYKLWAALVEPFLH